MPDNLADTREWLAGVAAEGLSRVELVANLDKAVVREWRWTQAAGAVDEQNLDARAAEIVKQAERDGLLRAQKEVIYLVQAFRREDQGGAFFAKHGIRVAGGSKDGNAGEGTYEASAIGLAQLCLKSTETFAKLLHAANQDRTGSLERQIQTYAERDEQSNRRHIQVLQLVEDLTSAKLEREHTRAVFQLEERKHDWLKDQLEKYVPVALNRALGGGPGTGKLYMGEEIVRQLFGSLSPQSLEAIGKGLPVKLTPEQAILLLEIYTTYAQAEEKKREARALNGAAAGGGGGSSSGEGSSSSGNGHTNGTTNGQGAPS